MADLAQSNFIMQLPCNPANGSSSINGSCNSSTISYLNNFREVMLSGQAPVLNSLACTVPGSSSASFM